MTWLPRFFKKKPKVAVVRLEGTIAASMSFGSSLNDANTSKAIEKAFSIRNVSAVALLINSPGGSPVQSSLIANRISRLAKRNKVKVIAFCEDVAASGGYWLACAADDIYADKVGINIICSAC